MSLKCIFYHWTERWNSPKCQVEILLSYSKNYHLLTKCVCVCECMCVCVGGCGCVGVGSAVVELSTHNPNDAGSNPPSGIGRVKMAIETFVQWFLLTLRRHDTHHNDIQHNGTKLNDTQHYGLICNTQHNWHSLQQYSVSLYCLSYFLLLCWVLLCWMSFSWVSSNWV